MAVINVEQALDIAIAYHKEGRLAEAETTYRQILAVQPNNPDALNLLGLVATTFGRHHEASELIEKATILCPGEVREPLI